MDWMSSAARTALMNIARYFLLSGGAFAVIWYFRDRLKHYRIQIPEATRQQIYQDIKWSVSTALIQAILTTWVLLKGHSKIYTSVSDYGWFWLVFSVIPMMLILDAYFYFSHRLLHWKPLMKWVHITHHRSKIPTAFSTIAFHPGEALIQWLVFPLIVYTIPCQSIVLAGFFGFTFLVNNLGHLGYEFYPRGFTRHPISRWSNTSTFHNMHHTHVSCNYGLYFNFLDTWLGTTHRDYNRLYDQVKDRSQLT
jgi:lathosterol oxidase